MERPNLREGEQGKGKWEGRGRERGAGEGVVGRGEGIWKKEEREIRVTCSSVAENLGRGAEPPPPRKP